jgi:hypothetical protein
MKKMLITAAALAVAVSTAPYLAGQAQAAPAKSPYCNMAKASNNGYAADLSWAEYYGCWGGHPARTAQASAPPAQTWAPPAQAAASNAVFCNMPKASNNGYAVDVSWAEHYGCWRPHR